MSSSVTVEPEQSARDLYAPGNRRPDAVSVVWLGQAGFLLRGTAASVVIDPYLSDSLAEKYRGRQFDHARMTPPPLGPAGLSGIDLVLITHSHSDHCDPGSIPHLAAANPGARFVIPRACLAVATDRGVPADRCTGMTGGESIRAAGIIVSAITSAHEQPERDEDGDDRFLGYVIEIDGIRFYHSGDCIPYDGLADTIRGSSVDVALLPVNGRDEYRASRGVPGNFTVEEAYDLAATAGAGYLVVHHVGMFAFNTVDPSEIGDRLTRAARLSRLPSCAPVIPEIGVTYRFSR